MAAREVVEVAVTSNLRAPTCCAAGTLAFRTVSIGMGHVVAWLGEGALNETHTQHTGLDVHTQHLAPFLRVPISRSLQTQERQTRNHKVNGIKGLLLQ